jgi:anti-sigma factor RsiW
MFVWRRRQYVCQEIVELITDYLLGNLSGAQRRAFDAHLAGCEHCTEYLRQMRATIRLTGQLRAEDLTPEMSEQFSSIFRRWRAEGAGEASGQSPDVRDDRPGASA